jgi:hypothetical protein
MPLDLLIRMSRFTTLTPRQLGALAGIILGALVVEFFVLESTIGISLPSDRYSAISSGEIKVENLEPHFITQNHRFTGVRSTGLHPDLMLREFFLEDRTPDLEGAPGATVTVDGMYGDTVRWSFREPGVRGDPITDNIYRVVKYGCCGGPNTYSYFSLGNGRKIRTSEYELPALEITDLERSLQ